MLNSIYKWTENLRNKLNEKGQGMVEYGIVLAVVAAIAITVFGSFSSGSSENATTGDGLKGAVQGAYNKATDDLKTVSDTDTN